MGNVINFPISLDSDICRELIVDCARYSEGLLTEKEVKKKHRFTPPGSASAKMMRSSRRLKPKNYEGYGLGWQKGNLRKNTLSKRPTF